MVGGEATCPNRNYLRVRGEYTRTRKILTRIMELPPRARRILKVKVLDWQYEGTTSACAENTCRG